MRRAGVATIGRSLSEDLAGHWLSPPIRSSHSRPSGSTFPKAAGLSGGTVPTNPSMRSVIGGA